MIARTGFFVLCSVFKEHSSRRRSLNSTYSLPLPEPGTWLGGGGELGSGLHVRAERCSPERRTTLAGPSECCNSAEELFDELPERPCRGEIRLRSRPGGAAGPEVHLTGSTSEGRGGGVTNVVQRSPGRNTWAV